MRHKLIYVLCILALIGVAQLVNGFNYMYFSETEVTVFGEESRYFASDTLWSDIRTNGCFQCMQGNNNIYGLVMMSCTESNCIGDNIYTGVPVLPFPENADPLREAIPFRGGRHFDAADDALAYIGLRGSVMHIWWGTQGTPLDTNRLLRHTVELEPNGIYFFECPIRISGPISQQRVVIASSGDIGLVGDVYYYCLDFTQDYEIPSGCEDMLALVAEGNVIVMNTWANGRNNRTQGSDIVISALVVALGESFVCDQQNDTWDTYIGPNPDERGTIHLRGALAQYRYGYVHRSNQGGTGYMKDYLFDHRLQQWNIGLFYDEPPIVDPPELNFGDVVIGQTAWDTLTITPLRPSNYSGTVTSLPFYSPSVFYPTASQFHIPVSFSPSQERTYNSYIYFYLNGVFNSVNVSGSGIDPPESQGITASAYPNPFNAVTTLSLSIPNTGNLKIVLYDLLGREVERIAYDNLSAGQQTIRLDMSNYASGVYFARLQSGNHTATHKLLLLK